MGAQILTVDVDTTDLSRMIGNQLLLDGDDDTRQFAYLAGIAFDGMTSEYDLVDVLVEYVENEETLDLTSDEIDEIESLLADAHTER